MRRKTHLLSLFRMAAQLTILVGLLNRKGKTPDGLSISKGADNTLMFGANQCSPGSTNATGHIQFYTRQTASFSLMDRGSTNHGTPVDREGFRVGIGPSFNEGNFPKGRVEIHNTADFNCASFVSCCFRHITACSTCACSEHNKKYR